MVKIENSYGVISITDEVFTNLAGDAAASCFGVKGMAPKPGGQKPFQFKRDTMSRGVQSRMEEDGRVALELHIAVDQGVNIGALCHSIIGEVAYKVEQATGIAVSRVDVYVDSMLID